MSADEKSKLKKEIAFYTALLDSHKNQPTSNRDNNTPKSTGNQYKWTGPKSQANPTNPRSSKLNINSKTWHRPSTSQQGTSSTSEQLVSTGSTANNASISKRTAIKPRSTGTSVVQPNKPLTRVKSTHQGTNQRSVIKLNYQNSSKGFHQSSKYKWTSKSANEKNSVGSSILEISPPLAGQFTSVSPAAYKRGRFKLIKEVKKPIAKIPQDTTSTLVSRILPGSSKSQTGTTTSTTLANNNPVAVSKFKLVRNIPKYGMYSGSTLCASKKVSVKYKQTSFRTPPRHSPYNLSRSGKRLISRYKVRPASDLNTLALTASPQTKPSHRKQSPYKKDNRLGLRIPRLKKSHSSTQVSYQHLYTSLKSRFKHKRQYGWLASQNLVRDQNHFKLDRRQLHKQTFVSSHKLVRTPNRIQPTHSKHKLVNRSAATDQSILTRRIASRVLQKSAVFSLKHKKKDLKATKHCIYYMRYGKCRRGDKCFYIHDPMRISICTRFLRGTCSIENCAFSHNPRKEKVPVCQHFLRGCCLRESCPYLHVNVGRNAPVCVSFSETRFCPQGEKCKKLHTFICPDTDDKGSCPKGKKCRLQHPMKMKGKGLAKKKAGVTKSVEIVRSEIPDIKVQPGEKLIHALPAYISLDLSQSEDSGAQSKHPPKKEMKTKPDFLK